MTATRNQVTTPATVALAATVRDLARDLAQRAKEGNNPLAADIDTLAGMVQDIYAALYIPVPPAPATPPAAPASKPAPASAKPADDKAALLAEYTKLGGNAGLAARWGADALRRNIDTLRSKAKPAVQTSAAQETAPKGKAKRKPGTKRPAPADTPAPAPTVTPTATPKPKTEGRKAIEAMAAVLSVSIDQADRALITAINGALAKAASKVRLTVVE